MTASSYFRESRKNLYPPRWPSFSPECVEIEVSLKSRAARDIVGQRTFQERAICCQLWNSHDTHSAYKYFYISWAYAPNEVFVHEEDFHEKAIFVRNLTIGVALMSAD